MISHSPKAHDHHFTKIELVPIIKLDNKSYIGNPGDKSFLMRGCGDCPYKEAFDYGATADMRVHLKKLQDHVQSKLSE